MIYSKRKCLFLAMAIMSAVMTGCTEQGNDIPVQSQQQEINNYTSAADDVTVTGEVTAITGNRVTLRITSGGNVEMPEGERPEIPEGERPEMPEGERPEMPGGERPEMPEGERPEMPNGERPEMPEGEPPEKSGNGEEAVYTIPVGMTVEGLSGRKTDYSGITEGMSLTLTVSSDGVVRACKASGADGER